MKKILLSSLILGAFTLISADEQTVSDEQLLANKSAKLTDECFHRNSDSCSELSFLMLKVAKKLYSKYDRGEQAVGDEAKQLMELIKNGEYIADIGSQLKNSDSMSAQASFLIMHQSLTRQHKEKEIYTLASKACEMYGGFFKSAPLDSGEACTTAAQYALMPENGGGSYDHNNMISKLYHTKGCKLGSQKSCQKIQ